MRVPTRPGRTAAFLLLVAVTVPALAACGGEAEAETVPASRAEVRSTLVELYAGGESTGSRTDDDAAGLETAECFADALLERVTPADLRDGGVLDTSYEPRDLVGELDRTVAEAWTAAQMACTDFVEESTRAQEALTKGRLDADAYATCLEGRLDDATIHDASVSTLMARWDDPAVGEMSVAQSECSVLSVPHG